MKHSFSDQYTMTVDDLALRYLEHAKQHYRKGDRETSEVHCVRAVLRVMVAVAGTTRAREFGPKLLKVVRERMIIDGLCRRTINANVSRVRRIFSWAIAEELVPGTVLVELQAVQGLQEGRCQAVESDPVRPVSQAAIDAILPFVSEAVWSMVQLQLLTGMRSGEATIMRACDINMSGQIWEYTVPSQKTQHHGKGRVVYFGPKAQVIVREYLDVEMRSYLFDPRDSRRICGRAGQVRPRRLSSGDYPRLRESVRDADRAAHPAPRVEESLQGRTGSGD